MNRLLVSVVMATCNQAAYLRQALESLRAQTLPAEEFEVIVVNDGSVDETPLILRDYTPWLRLVERENRGLSASCNEGLALAQGLYFARLDSDDLVAPDWLAALAEALQGEPAACCAFPDRYVVDGEERRLVQAEAETLYSLIACGTLFRTDMLRQVGGFRPLYWEEYDLYLRLRQKGLFIHVPHPLYTYRRHTANMTSEEARRVEGWLELARVWGAAVLRSAGYDPSLEKALRMMAESRQ